VIQGERKERRKKGGKKKGKKRESAIGVSSSRRVYMSLLFSLLRLPVRLRPPHRADGAEKGRRERKKKKEEGGRGGRRREYERTSSGPIAKRPFPSTSYLSLLLSSTVVGVKTRKGGKKKRIEAVPKKGRSSLTSLVFSFIAEPSERGGEKGEERKRKRKRKKVDRPYLFFYSFGPHFGDPEGNK